MLQQRLQLILQYIIPQHLLSRLVGKIANCKVSWIKNTFIKWFVHHYQVDMSTAAQEDPLQYANFNSFFTRRLKPKLRPITQDENTIVSPVDGTISQFGSLQENHLLQAKGFNYDLVQLLGGSADQAKPFLAGEFITLYLAPHDYHRVHMPIAGRLQQMIYVPGSLFSVNFNTVENVVNLFSRNERVVCFFETAAGPMAIVLIGALIVASISTSWKRNISPTKNQNVTQYDYTKELIYLEKGDELGYFNLGSTVIVLFANQQITWSPTLKLKESVIFGQKMAELQLPVPCHNKSKLFENS